MCALNVKYIVCETETPTTFHLEDAGVPELAHSKNMCAHRWQPHLFGAPTGMPAAQMCSHTCPTARIAPRGDARRAALRRNTALAATNDALIGQAAAPRCSTTLGRGGITLAFLRTPLA
jgi:hypothetical protein